MANPEKTTKDRQLTPAQKEKLKGVMIIGVGLALALLTGTFLLSKFFRPQALAEMLPTEQTVALLQINIAENNKQVERFHEILQEYPVYGSGNLLDLSVLTVRGDGDSNSITSPLNRAEQLKPWLGRQVGLAFVNLGGSAAPLPVEDPAMAAATNAGETAIADPAEAVANNIPSPLALPNISRFLFAESYDHQATLEFLRTRTLNGEILAEDTYLNQKIYDFPLKSNAAATFINRYLVVADSKQALKKYLDLRKESSLSTDPAYLKVANNLPHENVAFGYVHLHKLLAALEENPVFTEQKGQDLKALRPFVNLFKSQGFSLSAEKDYFTARTFTYLDTTALDDENYVNFSEKYKGKLLSLLSEEPVFMAGGHNLTKELSRMQEIFKSGTKTPALIFEGLLEAQKQKYFGKDIGLKEDIYPLIKGEYLFFVEGSAAKPVVNMMLELEKNSTDMVKVDKVMSAFVQVSGLFSPTVREVMLPDGTMGKEIIATPEQVIRRTEQYHEKVINILAIGTTGLEIHYTIINNILVFSTGQASMHSIIDRAEKNSQEFIKSPVYSRSIAPLLRSSDQLLYFKTDAVAQYFGLYADETLAMYLLPFNTVTVGKNFFDDGIATVYRIETL